jgi:hypothetical protein
MKTFKEFINRYGEDTTTGFDLTTIAKQLKIPNFHVVMVDEIKSLKRIRKYPIYVICNYQAVIGNHWVCFYKDKDKDKSYYMDSYGYEPLPEAIDFLDTAIVSEFQIQPEGTKICGQLSTWVLFQLSKGESFYDIILNLNDHFNSSLK